MSLDTFDRYPRQPLSSTHNFATMSRPELQTPPELFYNDKMSRKYNSNSRMVGIQAEISNRCIELLNIPVREEEGWRISALTGSSCVGRRYKV